VGIVSINGLAQEASQFNMAHFVKLDENNMVIDGLVVNNNDAPDEASGIAFLNTLFANDIVWKQTSYHGNIRKNYAGIGYAYDEARDAFIAPQPFPSWVLNEQTCQWESPTTMPVGGKKYRWNEATITWIESV
jgi:hypothetical protein